MEPALPPTRFGSHNIIRWRDHMNHDPDDFQKQQRKERERRLKELGLRHVDNRRRCFHCGIPMDDPFALLCAACEGD